MTADVAFWTGVAGILLGLTNMLILFHKGRI